ncbi:MAG: ParB/RepB/Spo0J family partition protein [Candidatus Firestonebacteria bacterium]|nr:ParB/RepB/Spo0J family partition protein [Candidatus Firestonebacteria bacterium]
MKIALGKGLNSLIPPREEKNEVLDALDQHAVVHDIDITDIEPQKYQPRQNFDEGKLQELMASIKEQGIIQPVIVRKGKNNKYDLIAGERRYRACKALGLVKIPAILKDVSDEKMLELAIIENIQRENLNTIEEAESYQQLLTKFHLKQEDVAVKVGKDRATITNILRLLKLPDKIKEMISSNLLSSGHGRALLAVPHIDKQMAIADEIIKKGLSVRQVESLVKALSDPKKQKQEKTQKESDSEIKDIENNLQKFFGTKIKIKSKGKKGSIEIEYFSLDDLRRILDVIGYKY